MERLLDVPHTNNVHLISFADDITIIISGKNSLNEGKAILQLIEARVSELGLHVNSKKTKAFKIKSEPPIDKFRIQGKEIEWKDCHKILGIDLHKSLKWDQHIQTVIERLKPRINIMRAMTSIKFGLNLYVLRTFYIYCIRSIIDYAAVSVITANENQTSKLEKLHNKLYWILTFDRFTALRKF